MKRLSGLLLGALLLISGLASAQTYLMSQGGTVSTCSGTFYDSGGASGTYNTNESYTFTICSNQPGASVIVTFTSFNTESGFDELTIYNGPNTSSPTLVVDASGTSINGQSFESVGGTCLTFRFISDGSISNAGWAATISCGFPCQDYSINITGTNPPLTNVDSVWIDICQGETITFTANGTYPNSGANYTQSNATTHWYWSVSSNGAPEEFHGVGMTTLTHTFTQSGGYFINLTAIDANGCTEIYTGELRVRVSITPDFLNVTQDQTIVCPGEAVNFTGGVATNQWIMSVADTQVVQECITDDQGVTQDFCWEINAFQPGQTITSASDLESVCMNIEHSWIADVWIYIQCPNGQQAEINYYSTSNPCSGDYFGSPDHNDNCNPGTGYDYCWSMSGTQCHTDWCDAVGGTLPAGTYLPTGNFADLIGCPINGEWCVVIIDDWGSDDGTLFSVSLNFSNAIMPGNMWTINHTYANPDIVWTGNGIDTNSGGNATAHPNTPGNQVYTFSVTDNFGCTYDTTLSVTVRDFDNPLCCVFPIPNAGTDNQVCSNSYTFNGTITTGNTANWTMVSGPGTATWVNQTSPNATVTVSAYGTYVFQLYEQNMSPSCSSTDQIQITFNQNPTSTFTLTPIPCFGNSTTVTYTGNGGATATYNWDFGGAQVLSGSGAGPYQLTWSAAGSHTVSLQVVMNGCTSTTTTSNIIMPALLTHNLTLVNDPCYQSCAGRASILAQGGTAPYTYSWASGAPQWNNLCAGAYSITVTDQNGCTTGQNFAITEPLQLVVTNTASTDLTCYNSSDGTISVTATGGTGNLMYIWNDIGVADPVRVGLSAGNYVVSVVDANQCQVVEFFQLNQPDELLISISNDFAICEWATAPITTQVMGGTPGYVYNWDSGTGFEVGPSNITPVPHVTTTYSVYVEDSHGCLSNTATMTVTVSPELIIDTILLQHNRCFNSCDGSAELVMLGGIPPLQYSWGSATHVYNGLCAGIYPITVTDNIGCSTNSVFVITQPDEITYSVHTEPASCYGYNDGQATIYVQGGTEPYNYLWPNGDNDMTMVDAAGVYTVTVIDAHFCRIEVPITITQPDRIILQATTGRQICIGQDAILSASVLGGVPYYSYAWLGTDGSSYPTASVTVSPAVTTDYRVTVTDSHGCTSNVGLVRIEVYPPLLITDVVTSWDTVCPGDPAIIEVDALGGNGGPYMLHLQDGTVVPSPFTVYPQETTMYYITLDDGCGTPSVMDSIKINVYPEPENLFVSDRVNGCPGVPIQFTELSEDNGQGFLWNFGDNGYAIDKNPMHIYTEPGVYSVSLTTRSDFGCLTTRTIPYMITIFENPEAIFTATPLNVSVLDGDVYCDNQSIDADIVYWFFGDGDSSLVYSPWHRYEQPGLFEIILVAENSDGCTDTTKRSITVNGEFTFYAPTMFTPNGDGKNDCFRICGNGIDKNDFYMVVYDRWGNKVFETETYKPDVICKSCADGAWDGTNRGDVDLGDEIMPNGVYTWFCDFKDWHGTMFRKTGSVHLVR
ncbi:MAG TPA: PKD domain-containing protein [Bacteroidales bacterium]|nr:PKD domain-containing protein [Bacteroidales bacterium]